MMIIGKAAATMVALMMVLAFIALPVSAVASPAVLTSATIQSGGGDPPVVMAVWQQDTSNSLEDGDPRHQVSGPQFMPPIEYEGTKEVCYYAVVFDAQGPGTIRQVSFQIWHPLGNAQGLNDESTEVVWNEWDGSYKYQVVADNWYAYNDEAEKAAARAALQAAYQAGLVTFNGYTWAEIDYKLSQDEAKLFWGCADKYYKQPGGWYPVKTTAFDQNDNPSDAVWSQFYYVPVAAFELDFTSVNYGAVSISNWKPISGDATFGTSDRPTIRNIGNTWMSISIEQDDMGIGQSLINGIPRWDVEYGARLGDNSANWVYYQPYEEATLPNPLPLCNTMKLDFKIHILKAWSTNNHIGTMTITADQWWGDNNGETPV
ncbi:hypothetical protein J2T58_002079 [Methanocalculus alkaliphilus]|uniref:hypothetical protein n=1 Tax=Methanocalculus alkaliphilus TaxID=768730 RepID=UPI00209F32DC|nr:hypothetical protein [Methanocalculus alkaliphilus]MCP1716203.1 hypothetical protein [Methanocalculus alkaliphilus]